MIKDVIIRWGQDSGRTSRRARSRLRGDRQIDFLQAAFWDSFRIADQPYSIPSLSCNLTSYGNGNVQVSGACDCSARINYRNGIGGEGCGSDCRHMEARCKQIKARCISLPPKSTNRSISRACLRSDRAGAHKSQQRRCIHFSDLLVASGWRGRSGSSRWPAQRHDSG